MSDRETAERLNDEASACNDRGDDEGAERAYRAAMVADPHWLAPVYNLGLLFKYQGRWAESLEYNRRAVRIAPEDEAAWWNLGIAATALGRWGEAREAWRACGIAVPEGEGPPEMDLASTPVRLDPESDGEVVWSDRIDPARARITSVPLPASRFRWGDVVLTDGAEDGKRVVDGETYLVFNALQRLEASAFRTYVVELANADLAAINVLERVAKDAGGAAEDWGASTRILCSVCSTGTPHEHVVGGGAPAHPHCGLAAKDPSHAERIIRAWLAECPRADVGNWYEAPLASD